MTVVTDVHDCVCYSARYLNLAIYILEHPVWLINIMFIYKSCLEITNITVK